MRIWTVHLPPTDGAPRLLPERFSLFAALFGPLWLLAHGVWWAAAAALGAGLLLGALLPMALAGLGGVALALLLGFHGHDLRRAALAGRGWRVAGVVAAADADQALLRLFAARPELAIGTPR